MGRSSAVLALLVFSAFNALGTPAPGGFRFEVVYADSLSSAPLDGRVLLIVSTRKDVEPRTLGGQRRNGQPLFGIDVENWKAGQPAVVDATVLGYPISSLGEIPAGTYYVQAVLNRYTTFHRSDGKTIKLHADQWEGQRWATGPGNLVSEPQQVTIDPKKESVVRVTLTRRLPAVVPPKDSRLVKHIKFKSELVSKFWGQDIFIGAAVLLPEGFEQHPNARYPVAYLQGHFAQTIGGFRDTPPSPDARGADSANQARAYAFYQKWTGPTFPRMLVVMPQDPNPYYDDSYAVNSVNVGPYGDAMMQELIPTVEKQFRAIGQGWSRTLFGGSTGGWRTEALQYFHPDDFNGAWAFCPDAVDFRKFRLTNIYEDESLYYPNDEWKKDPIRPFSRNPDGQALMSERDGSLLEAVLGSRGRSGGQQHIFEAVFGPIGDDGYPKLLWDAKTGLIDKSVATYWAEHFDLRRHLEKNWTTLGPKLQGKVRIWVGDADTYHLDGASVLVDQFFRNTTNPRSDALVVFGKDKPHCWSGQPDGMSTTEHYLPEMAAHIARTAPAGADLASWKY